jgi:hypothetical protein
MKEESWRRHANPWSVWTRFAAIPVFIVAVWSRTWIGWWCLLPLAVVVAWLVVNPVVFRPVDEPTKWSSRGIYGERMWAKDRRAVPVGHRQVEHLLVAIGLAAFALLTWGLVALDGWPTVFGATLIVVSQLWRIDRYAWLFDAVRTGTSAPQRPGQPG